MARVSLAPMERAAVREALLPTAALLLTLSAFFLGDGSSDSRLFWIGSAAVVIAAVGWAMRAPQLTPAGGVFLVALALFVVWQMASIAWSIQPSRSWDYANRGLVYFAFAAIGVLLGGIAPRRLAYAAALVLGALFVWSLTAKVIPPLYSDYGRLARLRYPLGYWNELALLAAASVPIGLWLVSRIRTAGALLLYGALLVSVLTYSRVGIVLTVAAALSWLALDRDRVRVLGPLAVAWIVGAVVVAIALLLPGVSDNGQPLHTRVRDGLIFGLLVLAGAAAVCLTLQYVLVGDVNVRLARAIGIVLVALVLAALLVAVVRSGGPADFVRDRWHEFSNPISAQVPDTIGRLTTASSSNRWRWWTEAWDAFTEHPLQGTGAGTFGLTDRMHRDTPLAVIEPHSAPLQDLSETGIVGFLLIAAVVGAAAYGILKRERTPAVTALGLAALICVLHSVGDIDWDYVAVMGPLLLMIGALLARTPVRRRRLLPAAAAAVCALAALYSLASPWLSDHRLSAAYDALASRNIVGGRDEAKSAHAFDPLALEPLWVWALAESLDGRNLKALELYRQARDLEPKNPETWYRLGEFQLDVLHQPRRAYQALDRSWHLDNWGPAGEKGGALDRARCMVFPARCR
jgi:hypothetical protein